MLLGILFTLQQSRKKIKILQIIQRPQFRGAETFACQLSEHLVSAGHNVDVLFLFGAENMTLPYNLPFIHLKGREKNRWIDFSGYYRLNRIITSGRYDIVQANAGDTLKYASLSKKIFGWKAPLIFRNANKISDFLRSGLKKKITSWIMSEVDFVASVSNECRMDFEKTFPFFHNRIATLPIGVNTTIPSPYHSWRDIDVSGEGPFFLSVASFVPEKNHEGLIRIFSKFSNEHPGSRLLLIGEGRLKKTIQEIVIQNQLEDSVYFLGKRSDVLNIMPLCHALLIPSHIEGLPGVILEAFISKLPVAAYDVGGIREVVRNNETGFLIPKNSEPDFLLAMKEVISSVNNNLIEKAYQLVLQEYTNDKIAGRFLESYQNVLSGTKS